MAVEHAILVSLAERAASGYELARRFDASIGRFWSATHQQIYKVLGRMEADGWVAVEVVAQAGRPDKKVYALTAAGRDELSRWTAEPTPKERLRSEFAVKIRAMPFGDRDAILTDVRRRRDQHEETLAFYRANQSKYYPDPTTLDDTDVAGWLVLRGGIRREEAGMAWCDEILSTLERR